MLYYVCLEGYRERYTHQWAAPKTGWLERNWIKAGVDYQRIDPLIDTETYDTLRTGKINPHPDQLRSIKTGSVVDAVGRSIYTFEQVKNLLIAAERGQITDNDVILFDDFWTPGFEALPYAFHLLGVKPKMYAFLHAQSVDEFDFTFPMRSWMRPIERGFAQALDGIFVCCHTLKDLVVHGGVAPPEKVHVTGHPFSSEEVLERMPMKYRVWRANPEKVDRSCVLRRNQVVWSSRLDKEKNPLFFLEVAIEVMKRNKDARFVVCTSAKQLRSNLPGAVEKAKALARTESRFEVLENLTKEEYYQVLCESKVQFNSASQDFVAITLLEASVAGCYPVYPYFRSFPETFLHQPGFMYEHLDVKHAARAILQTLMCNDLWTKERLDERSWIHRRFDVAWLRMLGVMGVPVQTLHLPDEITTQQLALDPFDPAWAGAG